MTRNPRAALRNFLSGPRAALAAACIVALAFAGCDTTTDTTPSASGGASGGGTGGTTGVAGGGAGGGAGGVTTQGGMAGVAGHAEAGSDAGAGITDAGGPLGDAGLQGDAGDAGPVGTFPQVAAIFAVSCSGGGGPPGPLQQHCHSSSPFDGMLDLTVASAYSQLVNHAADIDPTVTRVIPGDPDASLLMRKLTYDLPDDESLGVPMPKGEAIMLHLPDEQIQIIRSWIQHGARPN